MASSGKEVSRLKIEVFLYAGNQERYYLGVVTTAPNYYLTKGEIASLLS